MFRIENIEFLYGFAIIPLLIIIFILSRNWRKRRLNAVGDAELVLKLVNDASTIKPVFKFILLMISFSALILAIANPQIGSKLEKVKREGIEIMLAVDVSNSMLSDDIKPNRLERTKQSILSLIDKLENDKIGIVVFAGKSFLQLPLTTDYSSAKLLTSTLSPELINTQGTAIGSAIELCAESFSQSEKNNKTIILLTDGENHEDDALAASEKAKDKGIIIHTVGMGSIDGGPIPIIQDDVRVGFRKDRDGNVIVTKLNSSALEQIASTSGGTFVRASSTELDLSELIKELSKLDKEEFDSKVFTDYDSKFQIFLLISLVFITIELLLSDRRNRFFSVFNKLMGGKV